MDLGYRALKKIDNRWKLTTPTDKFKGVYCIELKDKTKKDIDYEGVMKDVKKRWFREMRKESIIVYDIKTKKYQFELYIKKPQATNLQEVETDAIEYCKLIDCWIDEYSVLHHLGY